MGLECLYMDKGQHEQMTAIDKFIDSLLTKGNFELGSLAYNLGDQEDLLLCFVGFLVSKCLLRQAANHRPYGVVVFSKPGRNILENSAKRKAFVDEFMNFYES